MWKEKLGNYLIDISKYVLTGVVISSLFKSFEESHFFIYGIGFGISILCLVLGLLIIFKINKRKGTK
jgi:hypothetical protein